MKTYVVTITETMQKTVEVEASSHEEAERMVEQRWNDSEYDTGHLVMVDFIFGPAFICDCRGENLDSLSDEQIDRYGKMFRYPEHIARVNDTLLGIPYRPQSEQER